VKHYEEGKHERAFGLGIREPREYSDQAGQKHVQQMAANRQFSRS
jgi:hypothetical protein